MGLLAGCSEPGPETALEEYLSRLSRSLDTNTPSVQASHITPPPRPGQLRLPIAGSAIDGLDFLALRGCALQVTIGKRNSSLGRLAAPSQRLLLELEFLRLAPACVLQLQQEQRHTLAQTLAQAQKLKSEQLPALIFNATLASDEYRALWRARRQAGGFPASAGSEVITALEAIHLHSRRWLAGDYHADNDEFELLLATVAGGDAGTLWQQLATQAAWLGAANSVIARRQQRGPLCAPRTRYPAADIVPRVVQRYFIAGIQPHAAELGRRYYQLMPAARALEEQLLQVLPDNYLSWRQQRELSLAAAMGAPRQHVESIKHLLAPCGPLTLATQQRAS